MPASRECRSLEQQGVYEDVLDCLSVPPIVRLTSNLYVACFPLMKLVAARYVVDKALREKIIGPDTTVVETSSGSYALGMALACERNGLRFKVFTDAAVNAELKSMLECLNGDVVIVDCNSARSPQSARLAALTAFMRDTPNCFWPGQYDNADHLDAYEPFAVRLASLFGHAFTLVGSVGSGSSTCGTTAHLRRRGLDVTLVGVDTFNSVLFGLEDGKRQLRGLGNSMLCGNVHHELYDAVHWVDAGHAFQCTRRLYRETRIFAGPTTGASWLVAKWLAAANPDRDHLCISADSGHRYLKTVYNDHWMAEQGFAQTALQPDPVVVRVPRNAQGGWSCIDWGRQSLVLRAGQGGETLAKHAVRS
jgi:cysteine synthase